MEKPYSLLVVILLFTFINLQSSCPQDTYVRQSTYRTSSYLSLADRRLQTLSGDQLPRAIVLYDQYVTNTVQNCKLLSSVFNIEKEVSKEEYAAGLFYLVSCIAEELGYSYPTTGSNLTSRSVSSRTDSLTPQVLLGVYENSLSKYLYAKGTLRCDTSKKLARTFTSVVKDLAERIVSDNCPRAKVTATVVGFANFLNTLDMYRPDEVPEIYNFYDQEWELQQRINKPGSLVARPVPVSEGPNPLLKTSNDVCKINDKAVEEFYSEFRKQVNSCAILKDVFTLSSSITPAEFSRGTYYIALYFLQMYASKNPTTVADFMSASIRDVKSLKPSVLEAVHARFVAKYLLKTNVLNSKNAKDFARRYSKLLKQMSSFLVDKQLPRSKIVAIQFSWRRFLHDVGVLNKENCRTMAFYYGNEWRCSERY